jgi:hypothetical protein
LPDVSLRALPDVAPGAPVVDEASRFGVFICEVDGDVADPPVVAGDVAVPVAPVAPVLDGEPVVPEVPWAYALPTASEIASVSADNAAREVFMRSLLMLVDGSMAGFLFLQHARHIEGWLGIDGRGTRLGAALTQDLVRPLQATLQSGNVYRGRDCESRPKKSKRLRARWHERLGFETITGNTHHLQRARHRVARLLSVAGAKASFDAPTKRFHA